MKTRLYIAIIDDGHDTSDIEYYSTHRNGSKANLKDARDEMIKRWGYREAKHWNILNTWLQES